MEIIKLEQFVQPSGWIITLRELDTSESYPDYSCERLVNGWRQEGWYGCEREMTRHKMEDWELFEKKIGSKER